MFYVKARTGKRKYEFMELEKAMDFAKKKSIKGRVYTVFGEDGAITTFVNHAEIPKRVTLYYRENTELFEESYQSLIIDYDGTPAGPYPRIVEEILSFSVEIASVGSDAIRIMWRNVKFIRLPDTQIIYRFIKSSITFHRNGMVRLYYKGRVRCMSNVDYFYSIPRIEASERHYLKCLLSTLRPEISFVLAHIDSNNNGCDFWRSLISAFEYPNRDYIIDTFHHTAVLRNDRWEVCLTGFPHELMNEDKCIEYMARKYRVPCTPMLKKIYTTNIDNICFVSNIMRSGITDQNYILRLCNLGHVANEPQTRKFVRSFIATRGTKHVVHLLEDKNNNSLRDIIDSARMAEDMPDGIVNYIYAHAKTMSEIHNTLVAQSHNNIIKNVDYVYCDTDTKRFVRSYGNIRFELPESRRDLAIIGANMGICVGSYYRSVENKSCIIIKVRDGEDYIACIEVIGNRCVQLKAKFNNMVDIKYKPVIDTWLNDAGLMPDTEDYNNIGVSTNRVHNYADLRPERIVDQTENNTIQIVKDVCPHVGDYHYSWYKTA